MGSRHGESPATSCGRRDGRGGDARGGGPPWPGRRRRSHCRLPGPPGRGCHRRRDGLHCRRVTGGGRLRDFAVSALRGCFQTAHWHFSRFVPGADSLLLTQTPGTGAYALSGLPMPAPAARARWRRWLASSPPLCRRTARSRCLCGPAAWRGMRLGSCCTLPMDTPFERCDGTSGLLTNG